MVGIIGIVGIFVIAGTIPRIPGPYATRHFDPPAD
jgi:hypothetical protein